MKLKMSSRLLKKKARRTAQTQKRNCKFCSSEQVRESLDYKNVNLLKGFITERGKILPARISGTCAKHQRVLSTEIKNARIMALLPFASGQLA